MSEFGGRADSQLGLNSKSGDQVGERNGCGVAENTAVEISWRQKGKMKTTVILREAIVMGQASRTELIQATDSSGRFEGGYPKWQSFSRGPNVGEQCES